MRRREDTQMMMMLLLLMVMMLLLMMMMMLLLMMMMVMVMIICSDNVVLMSLLLFKEEPFAQTLSRAKKLRAPPSPLPPSYSTNVAPLYIHRFNQTRLQLHVIFSLLTVTFTTCSRVPRHEILHDLPDFLAQTTLLQISFQAFLL